ncbi:bifunctional folylpolyglutamate synthase dihydrofolate synthase : Folyl-polyglutamate synthetase OS=Planctomyces maris DSM 8797 GN=PM8797T_30372 PE=4 SV=1: Mur_ligase_M: Mur_ligase_C [Gemmataceae bacterium]|nr:bifunctional folylpolyglutamate synthase dihydrofolate synthase : Folyl-polyglutamate synthetase OS=Planctomyces maris DSM 8797 GN=PM8797T_30372 PE=4 SV=1: Mur_ligase_M: Mur_ligase_C [Gemmataceae bacterium]VTT99403.1 bifunctional folylpolyglutamate synthase dihydrofolate synthase : Folyl-polyglutamate synthetase OS=Planctomyces maris DSM 8797 GN=PM8797T_30372 PE=4 SV=1: Mur_ligase_M: Mur_ligase_C [Gemmataceae bacterium]
MTYDEAIAFWYGRINFEVRAAQPADLKLERMAALLRLLGDPHDRVRTVHVTGTKGKGSTCAMIAQVLRCAGYRVGLFTSPHLEHVEERIQVDGANISHPELAARITELAPAVRALEASGGPGVSFFEIGTALGFLHFCYRRCDVAVVEVGLGGRFDSTNVCHPLVSVVTNVGLDHTAQLGNTLEEIAYQKAGIIKPRVPVVSGVTRPGPREVVRRTAAEMSAPLREIDEGATVPFTIGLLGQHQQHNAACAVAAVAELRAAGMPVSGAAVERGLATVRWPARVEVIGERPVVILDTAHNVPSAEALVRTLREAFPTVQQKTVVFAVSADKQYQDITRILAGYFDRFYLTKYANPRAVPPEKLAAVLAEVAPGKAFSTHAKPADAWAAARAAATPADLICVTGSVFLAGELRLLVSSSTLA